MVFVREILSFFGRYNMYCHVGKKWNPKLFLLCVCLCVYMYAYTYEIPNKHLFLPSAGPPGKKRTTNEQRTPPTHICWLFENLWATLNYEQSISRKMKMTVFLFFLMLLKIWFNIFDLLHALSGLVSLATPLSGKFIPTHVSSNERALIVAIYRLGCK